MQMQTLPPGLNSPRRTTPRSLYSKRSTDVLLFRIAIDRELQPVRRQGVHVRWDILDKRQSPKEVILASFITREALSRDLMNTIKLAERTH
jgi:hypothetical protein